MGLPNASFVPQNFCRCCSLCLDILILPYCPVASPATLIVPRFCCDTISSGKPFPHLSSSYWLPLLGPSNSAPALIIIKARCLSPACEPLENKDSFSSPCFPQHTHPHTPTLPAAQCLATSSRSFTKFAERMDYY